jgi:ferredoxin-thioredoxin reductase catalytic subunit
MTDRECVKASVVRTVTKYVERRPFFLNPDKTVVDNIIAGLVRNKIKYGRAYCPCREVKGTPKEDSANICPCRTHKEEIARQGTCECGLFVSEAYLNAKSK